jgi:phage tail-like protein
VAIRPELVGSVFVLSIDATPIHFQTCSGLGSTSEVIEDRQTDPSGHTIIKKIPGMLKWPNLVLQRGVDPSTKLWTWRQLVIDGKMADARKTGVVEVWTADGKVLRRWEFARGWPCAWQASSDEDASGIVIERIEIAHEGLKMLLV